MVTTVRRPVQWLVIVLAAVLFALAVHEWGDTSTRGGLATGTALDGWGTLQEISTTGNATTLVFESRWGLRQVVTLTRSGYEDAIRAVLSDVRRSPRALPAEGQ